MVANSLGVYRELVEGIGSCQDGAREFAGRRSRLAGRLSGVAERLAGSWFNHDGEKELHMRHRPRIKFRHRAKIWIMRWELTGSSLGLH
ncbi:hypothetical protein BHM03_00058111 [Ensete ventricosum]|nr:hypothetical protein BHM03_00058111 [Ensete ventricosum]